MSAACFLLDEHIPRAVARGLALREPAIQVFILGRSGAPSLHVSDPELLIWIEEHACLLVTNNRASMPMHLQVHLHHGVGMYLVFSLFPDRQHLGKSSMNCILSGEPVYPMNFKTR